MMLMPNKFTIITTTRQEIARSKIAYGFWLFFFPRGCSERNDCDPGRAKDATSDIPKFSMQLVGFPLLGMGHFIIHRVTYAVRAKMKTCSGCEGGYTASYCISEAMVFRFR